MRELPKGWEKSTIGEVCEIGPSDPPLSELAPFIPMASVEVGLPYPRSSEPRGTRGGVRARSGDLLFARITPCLENGKVALIPEEMERAGGSTEFIVVRPPKGITPALLYFWALHPEIRESAQARMTGTTGRMRLSASDLEKISFWLPPEAEQERIVEAIEEAFSKLDVGEAGLRRVRKLLKRIRDSVLAAAVTGRLVPQDPTETPATKLLADLGVAAIEGGVIPVLPDGWALATVGDLLSRIEAGKSYATLGRPAEHKEIGVIKVSAMTWGSFRAEENKAIPAGARVNDCWVIRGGDLLFSRANTSEYVGACVLVPTDFPNLMLSDKSLRLVPHDCVSSPWLLAYLRSRSARVQIEALATGTKDSMRNISQAKLRNVKVAVPPQEEQIRIMAEVERQLSFIEACEQAVDVGLARSAALRRSVLKAAFEGRLVPQDPTDEPAAALLERIRAERAGAPKPRTRRARATS